MVKLSLRTLGTFEVLLDQQSLTHFRTNKVQALLIYLVVEAPTVHQREALMELLWPGLPLKSAQVNLRQILYQLNKVVPTVEETDVPFLISSRKTVELHPDYPITNDLTALTKLLRLSWQHNHRDILACPDCRQWLEDAIHLYKGEFMSDFSLYDSNIFESWIQVKREAVRRQTLDALDTLTHVYLAEQDYQLAEKTARHQLRIDNLRENAYRQLMQVLALTGRRSEAVALYDECQRLLLEELGMAPSAKTTALSEQIKGGTLSVVTPMRQGIRGYDLGEKLGEGAFGTVYKAHQKGVGREVAIKIIHAKFANLPRFIRRFEAEAQIIARLEHPHIVPLYDYWREPDGACLVMRWLRGGSLQAALEKEPFEIDTAVKCISQIAIALHTAHRNGIVHRDVKPANILLDKEGNSYLSDFGIARDLDVNLELTGTNELVGSPAYISPEQLLGEEVTSATDIYCLGLVLYELLTGKRPYSAVSIAELVQKQINEPIPLISSQRPELPPILDEIIQQATAKKANDRFKDSLTFVQALQQVFNKPDSRYANPITNSPITIPEGEIINPYKGLQAFQEQDAKYFYGRKSLIKQLLTRLTQSANTPISQSQSRFLAIVGPSGSGKSSVVKAGLLPELREGAITGSQDWFIVEMTPGSYPLEELEAALMRVAVNPPPSLLEPLQKDERGLARVLKRLLPQDRDVENPTQLLLLIDQFEELFTLVKDEETRSHFLSILFSALTEAHSRLWIIITLRADFYDRPLQLEELGEWLRQRTEIVLPMNTAELEEVILAPAGSMGITLEQGLVSAIITDVKEQPGALPLMQYALTELFERRDGRILTMNAYEEIGGVTGALAHRADEIYEALNPIRQEATRQLFLRLVTLGEGVEDTRRRVSLTEVESLSESEAVANRQMSIINRYGHVRLLTFDHDPVTRKPTVEVAHEALLREWGRLRDWLEESRDDVRMQRILANEAKAWETAVQDSSYLLRGSRLAQFENWVSDSTVALTQSEKEFIEASIATREQQEREEEARRLRELETVQQLAEEQTHRAEEQAKAAQSLRQRAVFLTGALIVAAFLAIVAGLFSRQASQNESVALEKEATAVSAEGTSVAGQAIAEMSAFESEQAYAQVLAVQAQQALADGDSELAILLALAANEIPNPPNSLQKVLLDAAYAPGTRRVYQGHTESVSAVAVTDDGQTMLSGSADNSLIIWDIATGEPLSRLVGHTDWVNDVALSPDNQSAVSTSSDGSIIWWDLETGSIKNQMVGYRLGAWSVAFHPNNEMALSGGSVVRFLSEDGTREQRSDGKLILWDLATGQIVRDFGGGVNGHQGDVWSVALSPDGNYALVGSDETLEDAITLIYWDIENEEAIYRFESMKRAVYDVAISPDGRAGLAASADGTLTLWDLATGDRMQTLSGTDDFLSGWALSVTFSPDGRSALATYGGGQIIWWNLETGQQIQKYLGHDSQVRDAVFLPDGVRAISAGHEGILRLWDLDNQWIVARLGRDRWQHQAPVSTIAISADGNQALSGAGQGGPDWPEGGDNDLILWDLNNAEPRMRLVGHTDDVTDVTFSADSLSAFSSSHDRSIIRWDLANGEIAERISTGGRLLDAVNSLDISPNGGFGLITRNDPLGVLWDLSSGQPVRNFLGHTNQLADMVFLANGTKALSASHDGTLIMWDVATGRSLQTFVGTAELPGHAGSVVYRLAVSPDEQTALSAGWDRVVILWDLETGQPIHRLLGHQGSVTGVAYLSDGQTAVSTSADGSLIVWDLETGELQSRFASSRLEPAGLSALAVSSNDQTILTGDFNGQISQWQLEPPQTTDLLMWLLENRIIRQPTCQERDVYRLMPLCETIEEATPVVNIHIPMAISTPAVTPLAVSTSELSPQSAQLIALSGENKGMFSSNKRDIWTYGGVAGEKLSIYFESEREEVIVNLQLFSLSGNLLTAKFDGPIESLILPTNGIYRIEVSSSLAQAGEIYTLIIESTLP